MKGWGSWDEKEKGGGGISEVREGSRYTGRGEIQGKGVGWSMSARVSLQNIWRKQT